MSDRIPEKIFLWIVKIGLWIIPFLPLYVSSSMLFPFITGKNFSFRIIVEIVFIFWIGLAVLKKEYRPQLTPLFKAVTIFISVLFLADLFGMNPYRSFFSNYERMEGFMMIFHLYLYFLMVSSVFRKNDWIVFFHLTLLASLAVPYMALLQKLGYRISLQGGERVDSTIGNPTYLASYLLFHVWLLAILIYRFWRKWWAAALYAVALIFEAAIIYFTATRGATLALIISLFFFGAAVIWFWPKIFKRAEHDASRYKEGPLPEKEGAAWDFRRKMAVGALILVIVIPAIFWQMRDTEFIKNNSALARLTRYSFQERTIQSRFMIWGMSYKAVLERPVFGWGQENYYLVFQKYFDPGLFANEPWFDRSHNVVFDWLIHAGFLGLAAFLSIFAAALWMLRRGMKSNVLPYWEGLVIAAAFLRHMIQNIFVFDNLNTYLLLFAFLAYVQYLVSPLYATAPQSTAGRFSNDRNDMSSRAPLAYALVLVFAAAFLFAGYFLHMKPILQSKALIRALQAHQMQVPIDQLVGAFQGALDYNSFGTTEVREQLSTVARSVVGNANYKAEERKRFTDFAVEELRKEAAYDHKDVKHMLFIGSILGRALQLDPAYAAEAEGALKEAIGLSPTKQIIYFELAQLYLSVGKTDLALETLRRAWELD